MVTRTLHPVVQNLPACPSPHDTASWCGLSQASRRVPAPLSSVASSWCGSSMPHITSTAQLPGCPTAVRCRDARWWCAVIERLLEGHEQSFLHPHHLPPADLTPTSPPPWVQQVRKQQQDQFQEPEEMPSSDSGTPSRGAMMSGFEIASVVLTLCQTQSVQSVPPFCTTHLDQFCTECCLEVTVIPRLSRVQGPGRGGGGVA